jgi:hypothetical protein
MTIQYVDAQQQPLKEAVVAVASAPGEIRDIAMVTDADGTISFHPDMPGSYTFSIAYDNRVYNATLQLSGDDSMKQVVVQ